MQWDLKYSDTSPPRLPWGLKSAVVLLFQLLGLCSKGRGQGPVHGECATVLGCIFAVGPSLTPVPEPNNRTLQL